MRDAQMMFNAVAGQTITATAASSNSIDLADALHQIGQTVKKISLKCRIVGAFSTLTSLDIAFQDSADNSSFNDTDTKISTVLVAKLVLGAVIMDINLGPSMAGLSATVSTLLGTPPGATPLRRYVRMNYTVNGSNAGAGSVIDSWLDVM